MYELSPHTRNVSWRPPFDVHAGRPWRNPAFNRRGPQTSNVNMVNQDYWCETCDRGFPSSELLDKHKGQHQKCNIDGCQFIAHPKVITKHIQMQHSSGLYKRIAKLDNPEEIQKWREERKKKYPTKSTIEKKTAEIKEKIERGEKMGLRPNRPIEKGIGIGNKRRYDFHNPNSKNKVDFKRRKPYPNNNQTSNFTKSQPIQKKIKILPPMEVKRKLQPFLGIQNIVFENNEDDAHSLPTNDLIEDDLEETTDAPANIKPSVCGALSSLMCDYGSSDDENNDQVTSSSLMKECETKTINVCNKVNVNNNTANNVMKNALASQSESLTPNNLSNYENNKSDDDSGPDEVKTSKKDERELNSAELNTPKQNIDLPIKNLTKPKHDKPGRSKLFTRPKKKLPSTLLTKLLHREMQQERNIILQCIRHIIKNDYFECSK